MLIIDTYNVLHAAPRVDPGLGGLTISGLANLLAGGRFESVGVVLVCDGSGGRTGIDDSLMHPEAPVRVVFAGPGKDADAAIQRLVMEEEHKGRAGSLTVVSSDKGVLASAIGPFGPKPRRMTSEQFLRAVLDDALRAAHDAAGAPTPKPAPLDEDGTARWLREFGIDPVAAKRPAAAAPSSSNSDARSPDDPTRPGAAKAAGRGDRQSKPPAIPAEEWPDGINPDDLDMRKWLKE